MAAAMLSPFGLLLNRIQGRLLKNSLRTVGKSIIDRDNFLAGSCFSSSNQTSMSFLVSKRIILEPTTFVIIADFPADESFQPPYRTASG